MFYSLTIPPPELLAKPALLYGSASRGKRYRAAMAAYDNFVTYGSGRMSEETTELEFTSTAPVPKGMTTSSFMYIPGLIRRERRLKSVAHLV